ncbi:MAG: translation initiation factor IF-5A [Nanoarchaeota archaeon]
MSDIRPMSSNELQKGSYIMVDGVPAKVVDLQTSKSGKHGHAKHRITTIGLIDEKKRIIVVAGGENVEVPIVEKKNAQVLSISDSISNVMDTETFETFDMEIPDELKGRVTEGTVVLYWQILGKKVIKDIKSV